MSDARVPLDVFVHSNPALSALVLYWTAKGYAKETSLGSAGLLFPWGMLSLATVCSAQYRSRLPKTTSARLTLYYAEYPDLRAAIPSMLSAWTEPFWEGLRYGASKGMLSFTALRVLALKARLQSRSGLGAELETVADRFGRMIAREGADDRVASALGIGFDR